MRETEKIRFGAAFACSSREYHYDPERFDKVASERLRLDLAEFIKSEKSETVKVGMRVEKRLEVYAATPKEFWEIVNREAEKIAANFSRKLPEAH